MALDLRNIEFAAAPTAVAEQVPDTVLEEPTKGYPVIGASPALFGGNIEWLHADSASTDANGHNGSESVGSTTEVTTSLQDWVARARSALASSVGRKLKAGGEWVARHRVAISCAVGGATLTAYGLNHGKNGLEEFDVDASMGGALNAVEALGTATGADLAWNAGAISTAGLFAIGAGLVISHRRQQRSYRGRHQAPATGTSLLDAREAALQQA